MMYLCMGVAFTCGIKSKYELFLCQFHEKAVTNDILPQVYGDGGDGDDDDVYDDRQMTLSWIGSGLC